MWCGGAQQQLASSGQRTAACSILFVSSLQTACLCNLLMLPAGVPPMLRRRPEFHGTSLAVRARVGGLATQLAYAGAHCVAHLTAAVSLLLLLELVGGDGWCLGADC